MAETSVTTAAHSHPGLGHLTLLVLEAVLEVVCVSLPGYIVASQGMFDVDAQKFVANLNVQLFTPCLIFTKLASQLTADKLVELAVIPFIFLVQTGVSYISAIILAKVFRFKKRPRNFVIAMGVFGNSNSLPISLVLSLSQTLKGLHWDKVPGDNDDEVGARGILYLLIFQQLGQLLRWSWGYRVLLAPAEKYEDDEHPTGRLEGGYRDDPDEEEEQRLVDVDEEDGSSPKAKSSPDGLGRSMSSSQFGSEYESGAITPVTAQQYTDSVGSSATLDRTGNGLLVKSHPAANGHKPTHGNMPRYESAGHITTFPAPESSDDEGEEIPNGPSGWWKRAKLQTRRQTRKASGYVARKSKKAFESLPEPVRKTLSRIWAVLSKFFAGLWDFMNPPLWAMLVAILVASVPSLQRLFFSEGTFLSNSVTRAVGQSGGVAVPLILVVLGANLAQNTLPDESGRPKEDEKEERNLLIASLISRMVLPTIIMTPLLALTAKYVPVSILDDPIFVIVCFLLTGAPSALQVAQICQVNNVYMGAMSRLLFQSYVVWILPSTLVLVMLALEVVEWAK